MEPTILSLHISDLQAQIDAIEAGLRRSGTPFSTRMSRESHALVFVVDGREYGLDEAERKFAQSPETT